LKKEAVVLFAHGSRDPQWARPFENLASSLRGLLQAPVALAYLESMTPTLAEAIDSLANKVDSVRVVPVFLGAGGHVKEDLPRLVSAARARHPALKISIDAAIGDQASVIAAIAEAISRS
jgi:sirohydrochlorin cobaltochelatase